jgi:hypothetical protein
MTGPIYPIDEASENYHPSAVTTAARRIARRHNQCGGNLVGGVLAFGPDGTGGEWYRYGARLPEDIVQVVVKFRRMTEREAQDILDWDREFYGTARREVR